MATGDQTFLVSLGGAIEGVISFEPGGASHYARQRMRPAPGRVSMLRAYSSHAARVLAIIVGLAALAACASASGPVFQALAPQESESVIYVYKAPNQIPAARGLRILLDGTQVGVLHNQGYLPLTASPGSHMLTVRVGEPDSSTGYVPNHQPLSLTLDAGASQFVRVMWTASGGSGVVTITNGVSNYTPTSFSQDYVQLENVSPERALPEIRVLRLSNNEDDER